MGRRNERSRLFADARRAAAGLRNENSVRARPHAPRGRGLPDGQDRLRGAGAPQATERAARARDVPEKQGPLAPVPPLRWGVIPKTSRAERKDLFWLMGLSGPSSPASRASRSISRTGRAPDARRSRVATTVVRAFRATHWRRPPCWWRR